MRLLMIMICWAISQTLFAHPDFKTLPATAWKFKTNHPIYSSAVVAGEIAYVGESDSTLYALNIETGKITWKFITKGEIRSEVSVHNDDLYLLSGDGAVYCLDRKTGKQSWVFKTEGEKKYPLFSFADYYQSAPVYENGIIYFGSGDHHIYAVNSLTGKLVWKFKTGSIVHTTPLAHGKKIYAGSFDGNFYCLNTSNGKLIWKFKTVGQTYFPKGEVNGSAGIFGKMVFFGARDFNFYALDTAEGFCHWNTRFQRGWAVTTPVIKDSTLFIGTSDDHLLLAMNPLNGNILWRTDLQYNIFGTPDFSDNMVYVGTLMGKLFALDRKNGKIVWEFKTDAYSANRLKYFKEDDSYRDDIFGGVLKKNEDFLDLYINMGAIFSKPSITEKYIIISSLDGTVYCLKR